MSGTPPFADRRYAVLGLGRNGLPAARALIALGASVTAWDDKEAARAEAERAGVSLADPAVAPLECDALVMSPGIPHILPVPHPAAARARAAGIPILSDAELLYQATRARNSRARFAGITGTNGKSTTTALLAHILDVAGVPVAAGGNLGTAALALPNLGDNGVYVLEMSSYMLERIAALRFDTAAMLNLTPDHLDRHGDMVGYAAAKRAIFARQDRNATAIIGIDDAPSRAMAATLRGHAARVRTVSGVSAEADVSGADGMIRDEAGPIIAMSDAPALPGAHNAQNAAAAAAMALSLGISRADVARGIASFPGLAHRQQRVGMVGRVAFINDSKATNADAAARALCCYERLIWIAGGIAKAGGIEDLAPFFPRIERTFLIGRDAPLFARTLASHGVPYETADTLEAALPAAYAAAQDSGVPVVLLSPAAASFDQFTGFEQRGERFAALMRALAREHAP